MPRRQRRHPAQRGRDRLRLDTTPEAPSSRASTPRVDSVSPGSLAVTPPTPVPATKNGAAPAWTYYSRNSSLERKRKLIELALKYGVVRPATAVSEESLGSSLDEFSDFDDDENERGGDDAGEQDERLASTSPGMISLLSLPPSHPFAGTTTMEQRQVYWDNLPTYSGASTPIHTPTPGSARLQFPTSSSVSTPSLPSSLSLSTLRPSLEVGEDQDDVIEQRRRNAIREEVRPIIHYPTDSRPDLTDSGPSLTNSNDKGQDKGKGKAKLLETLCCRAQSGTPVGQSRLPIRVGAALPVQRKYKVKKGLVRMPLDSRDDLGESPSSNPPWVSPRPRTPPSRPESLVSLLTPPPASSSSSLPSHGSEENQQSLEERLRNTTLEGLPLSQQDAEGVRELVAELVRDREGMSGTWPPRARRGSVGLQARGMCSP